MSLRLGKKTLAEQFAAFRSLTPGMKAQILAYSFVVTCKCCLSLNPPKEQTRRFEFFGMIGALLGLNVRAWREPSAEEFWRYLTKGQMLSVLDEIGAQVLRSGFAAEKKPTLAAMMERLCRGEAHVPAAVNARAVEWLPAIMRFEASSKAKPVKEEASEEPDGSDHAVAAAHEILTATAELDDAA